MAPTLLEVQYIVDETQNGRLGDAIPVIWLPASFVPAVPYGCLAVVSFRGVAVCSKPTFILPYALRESSSDPRAYKVEESKCIVSNTLVKNLGCSVGDKICLCSPFIPRDNIATATAVVFARVPSEVTHRREVSELNQSVVSLTSALLSGNVVGRGLKVQISWFNCVEYLAIHSISSTFDQNQPATPLRLSAVSADGEVINFEFERPKMIVDSTKMSVEPWRPEKFARMQQRTEPDPGAGESNEINSSKWISNVLNDVQGVEKEVHQIVDLIRVSLEINSTQLPFGFVIWGPHGTGKTALLYSIPRHSGLNHLFLDCSAIFSSNEGDAEKLIGSHFERAKTLSPSILVLDDLDIVASSRHDLTGEMERRVVSRLLSEINKLRFLQGAHRVFVLASCSKLERLDQSLLQVLPFESDEKREEILAFTAANTHGRVGADLENLCRMALIRALSHRDPLTNKTTVTMEDFEHALNVVGASGLAELARGGWNDGSVTSTKNSVRFSDIGGLKKIKNKLLVNVVYPFRHPEKLAALGIPPPTGVLLIGPPGSGKTLLANAVMTESGVNTISIAGTELLSQYIGDSEKRLADLFKRARACAPCIVFIDQFESIARTRSQDTSDDHSADRVLSCLLTELDGIGSHSLNGHVILIAATNKPELLDSAILRPGRIDCRITVPLPAEEDRRDILLNLLSKSKVEPLSNEQVEKLISMTAGFTGADLANLFREAAFSCLRKFFDTGKDVPLDFNAINDVLITSGRASQQGSSSTLVQLGSFGMFGNNPFQATTNLFGGFSANTSPSNSTGVFTMGSSKPLDLETKQK